jgi:hypothetical protein
MERSSTELFVMKIEETSLLFDFNSKLFLVTRRVPFETVECVVTGDELLTEELTKVAVVWLVCER